MLFASSVSLPPDFKGTSITLALTDHSADRECDEMLPLSRSLGVRSCLVPWMRRNAKKCPQPGCEVSKSTRVLLSRLAASSHAAPADKC